MKYSIFFISFVIFQVAAAENLDQLVERAGDKSTYPQASSIVVFDRAAVRLTSDGRTFSRRELLLKIVDERAKDEEGDQSIRFNAESDTVIIETAKSRLPDGQWIEPEKDAFTVTSAPEVQWASAYSQLKQQNISFPGMDVGAAIYLVYRIEPKPDAEPEKAPRAGGIGLFGGTNPILEKTFELTVEKGRSIQFEVQNGLLPVRISTKDGKKSYRWEVRDVQQLITEPNMISLGYLFPRLVWTTFKTWDELGLYLTNRFWGAVDTSDKAIAEFMQVAYPGLQGKPAVYNTALWISQNIRDVGLPLGRVGYEPNTADRVWSNKYGDPRDKCVLLAALLRGYGVAALPVVVLNRDVPFSELPSLEQFSHIMLCVPVGGDTIWVDPTLEYYGVGELPYSRYYGKACLLADGSPLLLKLPLGERAKRGAETTMQLTLAETGDVSGTAQCKPLMGYAATARAQFKDIKEQEKEIYFQQLAAGFGQGSKVTSNQYTDPADLAAQFAIEIGFSSPGYAVKQEDLLIMELPGNPFEFGVTGFFPSMPEAKFPIQLPGQARVTTEYSIELPAGYDVAYMPAPLVIENPYVYLELTPKRVENLVKWTQVVEIKAEQVPVTDYADLRAGYQKFVLPKNRLVMLEAVKKGGKSSGRASKSG